MSQAHPRCAVIGAANIDIGGFPSGPLVPKDSNPGRVVLSSGGVGRNIACGLARLGVETHLVAALGADDFAGIIRAACERAGMALDLAFTFPDAASSAYLYVADGAGDMVAAVNDMGVCGRLTPEALASRLDALNAMDAVVLDANLPEDTLVWLAGNLTVPLIADAVSAAKAPRLLPILSRLAVLKPNDLEAQALTGIEVRDPESAMAAARKLTALGAGRVFVTLGGRGVVCAEGERAEHVPRPVLPGQPPIVSATGAGDAFTAALAWARLTRPELPMGDAAILGMAAAALAMASPETVNPDMTADAVLRLAEPLLSL